MLIEKFETNTDLLCLANVSRDFSAGNMKRMNYMDISMIYYILWCVNKSGGSCNTIDYLYANE